MGISSPAVGFAGFVATDVVLQTDPTVYNTASTTPEEKITGALISDVSYGSTLRFKATLRNNAGGNYCKCRLRINGVTVASVQENGGGYVTHSDDFQITDVRGSIITIAVWKSLAGNGDVKDISICGSPSPAKFD